MPSVCPLLRISDWVASRGSTYLQESNADAVLVYFPVAEFLPGAEDGDHDQASGVSEHGPPLGTKNMTLQREVTCAKGEMEPGRQELWHD